jgi:hypothetical protein
MLGELLLRLGLNTDASKTKPLLIGELTGLEQNSSIYHMFVGIIQFKYEYIHHIMKKQAIRLLYI